MRRSHLLILSAFVLIATAIVIPLRSARAGEITNSGFQCWMDDDYVDLNGVLPEAAFFTTDSYQQKSASGNIKMVCRYEGVVEDLAQAYTRMRFLCGVWLNPEMTEYAATTQSKLVLTPNGDMLFMCRLNHKDVPPPTAPSTAGDSADGAGGGFLPGVGPIGGTTGVSTSDEPPTGTASDGGAPAGEIPSSDGGTTTQGAPTTPTDDGGGTTGDSGSSGSGGNCGNDKPNGNGASNGCGNGNGNGNGGGNGNGNGKP